MAGVPWTDEEIQYLKDNFQDKSCEEIAKNNGWYIPFLEHLLPGQRFLIFLH